MTGLGGFRRQTMKYKSCGQGQRRGSRAWSQNALWIALGFAARKIGWPGRKIGGVIRLAYSSRLLDSTTPDPHHHCHPIRGTQSPACPCAGVPTPDAATKKERINKTKCHRDYLRRSLVPQRQSKQSKYGMATPLACIAHRYPLARPCGGPRVDCAFSQPSRGRERRLSRPPRSHYQFPFDRLRNHEAVHRLLRARRLLGHALDLLEQVTAGASDWFCPRRAAGADETVAQGHERPLAPIHLDRGAARHC